MGASVINRGTFKEWPLVQWLTRHLPYGPRRPLMKIIENLHEQDFYSFKLCMVDKVHAVRPMDNNDMPFPSQKFNSVNVWVAAKTRNAHTQQRWRKTRPLMSSDMIYFLIGLHCRLQLHWVTSEWSCLIVSHCIYDSWALCRCHFCHFAQLSCLLTWQLVLLQLRDRPSSKSCKQALGRPAGVVAP